MTCRFFRPLLKIDYSLLIQQPITMQKTLLFLLTLLYSASLFAQLTFKVTAIPWNTPAGASIHIAGTFNNWAPASASYILAPDGTGNFLITVNPAVGLVKFKFTRGGSWSTVEGDANGNVIPDRTFNYNGQAQTINLTILSWEDLGSGSGGNGTAAPNVQILDNNFYIPQLNRNRRIWLYLPPDYNTTSKNYPVLYMQDAQNLFDANTSFSGEWEIDESLNTLHAAGDYGCIVVGIDNGGQYRLDEYSPWINTTYGGGQGDEYIEFIANTLKPYIDANYHTLSSRNSTGIMGSSMGSLVSMYGFSERQDVFSRAGIFSPAFWFAGNSPANHVATHPKLGPSRVYFLAGGQEPTYVTQDMQEVADAMTIAGFTASEKQFVVKADGEHSEWFWRREFPAAYQWLFAGAVTSTNTPEMAAEVLAFPNPSGNWVRFSGLGDNVTIHAQVIGMDGKVWSDTTMTVGAQLDIQGLPVGIYFVVLTDRRGEVRHVRFVKA